MNEEDFDGDGSRSGERRAILKDELAKTKKASRSSHFHILLNSESSVPSKASTILSPITGKNLNPWPLHFDGDGSRSGERRAILKDELAKTKKASRSSML
jgi:hypothetical protein